MKTKRLKMLLPVLCIIILSIISYTIVAQAGVSAGCAKWNSFGSIVHPPSHGTNLNNQTLFAGEILRVSFTLNTATNATVHLDSAPFTPIQTQSFTSGSVSYTFIVPANGTYSTGARNNAVSNGSVNTTYSCQGVASNSASIINPEPPGFTDGRINFRDAAAPIVVYPYQDDTGAGFDIYSANGDFLWRVTGADLAAGGQFNPTHNIRVGNTAGGGLQISAPQYNGKTYILQFDAPFANIGYNSWEQE